MKLITIAISTPLTSLSIPALPKFLSKKVCVLVYKQIVLSGSTFDLCVCVTQFLGEMPFFRDMYLFDVEYCSDIVPRQFISVMRHFQVSHEIETPWNNGIFVPFCVGTKKGGFDLVHMASIGNSRHLINLSTEIE